MKVVFVGVFYYGGPVRHLYQIFTIYRRIARVFMAAGIECYYFSKQHEIFPEDETIDEDQFNDMLPEIDLLFMWNGGLGKEKEIAAKCKEQGTPVYFSELGWLPQMNTFYFDTEGVNYASTLTKWQYENVGLNEYDKLFLNSNLSYYHNIIAKRTCQELPEEDYVFAPLQVERDSQIINYSPYIKKMQEFVDYLEQFLPGKVIIKKHPKDDPGKIIMPDRFIYTDKGTTHDYLKDCKYCVTINSTVGIEALSYYKPVITLGKAFYSGRGISYSVNNEQDMYAAINKCETGMIANGIVSHFLHYLFTRQWHIKQLENTHKVMGLIYDLTKGFEKQ